MIEVQIPPHVVINAQRRSREMGSLYNSIEGGEGNVAGFIGEEIALAVMGGEIENTPHYDIQLHSGITIDVKTSRTSIAPEPYYSCVISDLNPSQNCDMYAFTRVRYDNAVGWFLGFVSKEKYFNNAVFRPAGYIDPQNGFVVKSDCYRLKISELNLPECLTRREYLL